MIGGGVDMQKTIAPDVAWLRGNFLEILTARILAKTQFRC